MDVKGTIIHMLPLQSGVGKNGEWKKQDVVIETDEQYPKKICFSLWGDKIEQYLLNEGEIIQLFFNVESREYNGKWYTDIRAWKIEKTHLEGLVPPPPSEESTSPSSSVSQGDNDTTEEDNLPF